MVAGRQKKVICGMEGEKVMAYGRLPSPAHMVHFQENRIRTK